MREILKDAALGTTFAGLGAAFLRFNGLNQTSVTITLYLCVGATVLAGFRRETDGTILEKLVVVHEGEELRLRKLITGERYVIKGEVEKI
ncbi:MAG: hypothetical protein ABEJ03_04725 [Candidatus Nanohaloarchaea archaeon]